MSAAQAAPGGDSIRTERSAASRTGIDGTIRGRFVAKRPWDQPEIKDGILVR
jgi:hypothetical protein